MTREELPELIKKYRVNQVLEEAAGPILEFLGALASAIQLEVVELALSVKNGERRFALSFQGHGVTIETIGASPGVPVGIGVKIFIDGTRVDNSIREGLSRKIHDCLSDRYSDTSTLHTANEVLELSKRL